MNCLIAVLTDRTQAEAAYSALEKEGLPNDGINILGGIFGAGAGALGAYFSGGAVGLTILQRRGYANGSGDALPYRNRLNAGKYLIIIKGTGELIDRATRVLRQFEPENIQGYNEPIGA